MQCQAFIDKLSHEPREGRFAGLEIQQLACECLTDESKKSHVIEPWKRVLSDQSQVPNANAMKTSFNIIANWTNALKQVTEQDWLSFFHGQVQTTSVAGPPSQHRTTQRSQNLNLWHPKPEHLTHPTTIQLHRDCLGV